MSPRYKRLCYAERTKIFFLLHQGQSIGQIAILLDRSKSTISRELRRYPKRGSYRDWTAQEKADRLKLSRRRPRKLDSIPALRRVVLSGLRKRWSPEQISLRLKKRYPSDPSMQISHEAIYTYLDVHLKGQLRMELMAQLRHRKKNRYRKRGRKEKRGKILEIVSIDERPQEVAGRTLPGHWEGDLVIGSGRKSAIGVLVERKTRFVLLSKLSSKRARTVRGAFERALGRLPSHMRLSLTYDRGAEMHEHKLLSKHMQMKVYFCHPGHPWEKGTCENTNGLIRDYFPKGTDFKNVPLAELRRVQHELNERPRKALDFSTPKEVFAKELLRPLR